MSSEVTIIERLVTAEELIAMPEGEGLRELVEGRVVELSPVGFSHGDITTTIAGWIRDYLQESPVGRALTGGVGFVLRRDPDTVRAPDVAFVSANRLPAKETRHRFFEGPPDLAIEVVSPSESSADVESKVEDYLWAGTKLVWVIYPELRVARVFRADNSTRVVSATDSLSGEDVLPGFELPMSELPL